MIKLLILFSGLLSNIYTGYVIQGYLHRNTNSTVIENNLKVYLNGHIETRIDQKGYFFFDKIDIG